MTEVERRIATLGPHTTRAFHDADWRDALVLVEQGAVELEGVSGARERFAAGDLLWLAGVPLRALHNPHAEPAVLVAISRRYPRDE